MKRIFDLDLNDVLNFDRKMLVNTIRASEGRTVMAETVVSVPPLIEGVSNPELAAAFGADMITLNIFDFNNPFVFGIDDLKLGSYSVNMFDSFNSLKKVIASNKMNEDYIKRLKRITGRFIGVNLEPVPERKQFSQGRRLNRKNLEKAKQYGFDYLVITGNPNTGVTDKTILEGIRLAREILEGSMLIIAGKMNSAGGKIINDIETLSNFVELGADCVLLPAPGTVPGIDIEGMKSIVNEIHKIGGLAMSAIGTSQEGSQKSIIENVAIMSKMTGVDIQHIGDAGFSGIAFPENIMYMSIAIRGSNHTFRRMAYSLNK
jgi:hypothetical protein